VRLPRNQPCRQGVLAALLLIAASAPAPMAARPQPGAMAPAPTREEIGRALEDVKADPLLAAERTFKTLRWNEASQRERRTSSAPAWLAGLFRWLDQTARVLVWTAAAVLAGLLVVFLLRMARAIRVAAGGDAFVAPTHVRDLDIRPETLPDDVGRAARALWDRGEHRAALALLYRGLLSRLAHVHRLPIRDSTTEGDCLTLAATHLTEERRDYAARLVRVWQRAVYGGEPSTPAAVYALCDGFAPSLDAAPALDAARAGVERGAAS
jgi:hypothetical protein